MNMRSDRSRKILINTRIFIYSPCPVQKRVSQALKTDVMGEEESFLRNPRNHALLIAN